MQLFMDRHDVPQATARDVADAHISDLEKAARHGVQFLSYWFDAEGGGVFCLAKAPTAQALGAVHRESHGLIPNEIISVAENDVLRFLGRISEPEDHTSIESPFRTIMFTDLVDSTAILEAVGQAEFLVLLSEHDLIVRRALVKWRGREVKHTGDGIMAAFDDVAAALAAGLEVRDRFAARSAGEGPALRVRVGLAAGRPVDHNDDIFGSTVVLASRICASAQAGQVLASDEVHEHAATSRYQFRELGEHSLKGFVKPVPLYEVVAREERPPATPTSRAGSDDLG